MPFNVELPARARVTEDRVRQGIWWLELHRWPHGYGLLYCEELGGPSRWDGFCEELEPLLEDCEEDGIAPGDWVHFEPA